jgi:hypothetical protein
MPQGGRFFVTLEIPVNKNANINATASGITNFGKGTPDISLTNLLNSRKSNLWVPIKYFSPKLFGLKI